jgi:hypothetical protein
MLWHTTKIIKLLKMALNDGTSEALTAIIVIDLFIH